MMARKAVLVLLLLGFGSGCFSTTRIYSRPAGATVVIDKNRTLGPTPVELQEQVWIWTKHAITVQAPGYQPQTVQLRSTGVNWGYAVACACTLGLLLPLGLLSTYPQQYVVNLVPVAPSAPQAALTETASVTFR